MSSVLCGVPWAYCGGAVVKTNMGTNKVHGSHKQAFECHVNYLMNIRGYTRIGQREFKKDDEPIRVLTKPIRFGYRLRPGKEGSRDMPEEGGAIISC